MGKCASYSNGFHMTEEDKVRMLLSQLKMRDKQIKLLELKATYLQQCLDTIGASYAKAMKTLGHHSDAREIAECIEQARSAADELGRYGG